MSELKPLTLDIVSDVVCPWCYIGKHRLESALALVPDVPIEVRWRPFFLNPWVPREGISREQYLVSKFGSVEAYDRIAKNVVAAAGEEGLQYNPAEVKRQPNTIDCHRLIYWAARDPSGDKSAAMKQRLMELYFRDGGDLTDVNVLVQAAADCGLDAERSARVSPPTRMSMWCRRRQRRRRRRALRVCRHTCSPVSMPCPGRRTRSCWLAPSARFRPR